MGYTHYWRRPHTIRWEVWQPVVTDVRKLVAAAGIPLCLGPRGPRKPPQISDRGIVFNGVDGAGHEPFRLLRIRESRPALEYPEDGLWPEFCKTAWKPYDLLVTSALLVLKHQMGQQVEVFSDGTDEAWTVGVLANPDLPGTKRFCQRVLGYGENYVMTEGRGLVRRDPAG